MNLKILNKDQIYTEEQLATINLRESDTTSRYQVSYNIKYIYLKICLVRCI